MFRRSKDQPDIRLRTPMGITLIWKPSARKQRAARRRALYSNHNGIIHNRSQIRKNYGVNKIRLATTPEVREELRKNLGWAIALGIVMIILGLVAIGKPFFTTLSLISVFAWLFIVGGIFLLIYAFQTRHAGNFPLKLLVGILYLIVGVILLQNSLKGVASALGFSILLKGIFQVTLALQLRPLPNWSWVLLSGITGVILGMIMWNYIHAENLLFLAIFVGIDLLFDGLWMVLLSSAVCRVLK
ncbi:HdeD family acid-resistance protein [Chlorogloeopsis sp. ULAP01]|uniref:HdeD family acid-resistance protein n=1 Tax=Chlorogloeopsis sp. ULAP01 TaxID=3056483 RepID=UPI0025ACA52F|nr:HdeD family acid-resistance protein [Chlorogloeopsis sp. ULAP01]